MNITPQSTIGDIVAENYHTARVFGRYNIDYCCRGSKNLEEVCRKRSLDIKQILVELQSASEGGESLGADVGNWPLELLADYIEKIHHRYVRERTPEIQDNLKRVVRAHGSSQPELAEIASLFGDSANAMEAHMAHEEQIVFPWIRTLVKGSAALDARAINPLESEIQALENEHLAEGDRFEQISRLSSNFSIPEGACTTYRVTFSQLRAFVDDLHRHIHLENNILFPKARRMEKEYLENLSTPMHCYANSI